MKKAYWAIFILFAAATAVSVLYFTRQPFEVSQVKVKHEQNTKTSPEPIKNLKNWKTYSNEKYGFELKYPKSYIDNEVYSIWDNENEWGVNKGQETIFYIEAYKSADKNSVVKDRNIKFLESSMVISGAQGIKIEDMVGAGYNLFFDNGKSIYIIYSSFSGNPSIDEYFEYLDILNNVSFTK